MSDHIPGRAAKRVIVVLVLTAASCFGIAAASAAVTSVTGPAAASVAATSVTSTPIPSDDGGNPWG
jgi:hypothetical protein